MNKKKVCIVGGGVAGISAAHHLLKRGYDVTIYEKNSNLGGLFAGYICKGYHIDICLHWMMGTKPNTKLFGYWEELNGLNKDIEILHADSYLTADCNGKKIHLYTDLDRAQNEWCALSPSDADAIIKFFNAVKDLRVIWNYTQAKKAERFDIVQVIKDVSTLIDGANTTRDEYAKRFKNKTIQFMIRYGLTGYNNTLFFLLAYAAYASGDSGIPKGGAEEVIKRAVKTITDEGCHIHTDTFVDEIVIENKVATGVKIDGKFYKFDVVISALDPNYTLKKLLKGEIVVPYYSSMNLHLKSNPISSCFVTYLVADIDLLKQIDIPTVIHIDPIKVGLKEIDGMLVRPYYHDDYFTKDGKSSVSLFFDQDQDDYRYYRGLSPEEYKEVKLRIAKASEEALIKKYPFLEGHTEMLTSISPLDLYNYSKTYCGGILTYSFTKLNKFKAFKGNIKGIDNLFFASQWNRVIGGSPSAVTYGRKVAHLVDKPLIDLSKIKKIIPGNKKNSKKKDAK